MCCLYPQCGTNLSGLCGDSPAESRNGGRVKNLLPGGHPPAGALPGEKEEQAGREPACPLLTFNPLQPPGIRMYVAGLRSQRLGSIIRSCRAAGKNPEYYLRRGLPGKLRHQWKFVPSGRLYFRRIKESDYLRSQHEQRGDVRGIWTGTPPMITGKHIPGCSFQTPEGMEEYRIAAVLKADVSMFDFNRHLFTVRRNWRLMQHRRKRCRCLKQGSWCRL